MRVKKSDPAFAATGVGVSDDVIAEKEALAPNIPDKENKVIEDKTEEENEEETEELESPKGEKEVIKEEKLEDEVEEAKDEKEKEEHGFVPDSGSGDLEEKITGQDYNTAGNSRGWVGWGPFYDVSGK